MSLFKYVFYGLRTRLYNAKKKKEKNQTDFFLPCALEKKTQFYLIVAGFIILKIKIVLLFKFYVRHSYYDMCSVLWKLLTLIFYIMLKVKSFCTEEPNDTPYTDYTELKKISNLNHWRTTQCNSCNFSGSFLTFAVFAPRYVTCDLIL